MSSSHEHGVVYSPKMVQKANHNPTEVLETVRYVRLTWIDYTSLIRYRVIPIKYFKRILESARPSISLAKCLFGLVGVTLAEGFIGIGEYLYIIDLNSIRLCGYEPDTAFCMGYYQEKSPHPTYGLTVPLCPRSILERVLNDARTNAGVEFLVGIETEFILLTSTDPITACNMADFSTSAALITGTVEAKVLEEIATALDIGGVEVQMYHAEAAPGQYEIVTGPMTPLGAADAFVFTRETIFNIASKHGLHATLAPRVYSNTCGSAQHMHVSVHSVNAKEPPTKTLSSLESSFLAGILAHLPETQAFTQPLPASYARVKDGVWSGGTYVAWGTENRETPVRLCHAASPCSRNFEIRSIDGLMNPYLAMAAIFGAGTIGIKAKSQLKVRDCAESAAATLNEAERQALGIKQRMCLSWEEARRRLASSTAMNEIFGTEMITKYLSANSLWKSSMEAETDELAMVKLVKTY